MVKPQAGQAHGAIVKVVRQKMEIPDIGTWPPVPMFVRRIRGDREQRALAGRPPDRQRNAVTADAVALGFREEVARLRLVMFDG
jgi:hypothetical protein